MLLVAFEVTKWQGEPSPGDDTDEVAWFDIDQVPELAFDTHGQALREALVGRSRE